MEPSTDNDDFGEAENRRNRQNRRRGRQLLNPRVSRYEQFHVALCNLLISLALPSIVMAIVFQIESPNTSLYLSEYR